MLSIGYQLFSCREELRRDPEGIFTELSDMGYEFVELAGLYGYAPETLREILQRHGLCALCAHVQLEDLEDEHIIRMYKAVGCKYIALSILMPEFQPGSAGYPKALEVLHYATKACEREGLRLLYHNHDLEFKPYCGRYALDAILEADFFPPLLLEPDCCWLHYSGVDPARYLDTLDRACPIVHVKDYCCRGAHEKNCLEIADALAHQTAGEAMFSFLPIGMGCVDIEAYVKAAMRKGVSALVVEQDISFGHTPMEAAKVSIAYLRTLLGQAFEMGESC